ncbi:hypothetical protein ACSLBF_00185 [Pseudoalteromonas sp. T1lg65]|uniref:hypothetical protein n=1 Tax=Pseudoalteromonas sp. T1lg65 TaxID=2077101 RepID=UPI003F799D98
MKKIALYLFTIAALTACQTDVSSNDEHQTSAENTESTANSAEQQSASKLLKDVSQDDIGKAMAALELLVENKHCDNDNQCKVIAVGSRACGGPSSYHVFSTQNGNVKEITAQAEAITKLESHYNAQKQMMSICQHLAEPSTQCLNNKCVKLEGNQSVY